MNRVWRLTLVHLCTMLIVLPVGGFCWLPLMLLASKSFPAPRPCCEHCCPKEKTRPAPKEPIQFPRCCSQPQQAFLRTTVAEFEQDDGVMPILGVDAYVPLRTGPVPIAVLEVHGPAPPLRVLHCVWRC